MTTPHRELVEFDYIEYRLRKILQRMMEQDPKQGDLLYRAGIMEYNTTRLFQRAIYEIHYNDPFPELWPDDFVDGFVQLFLLAILKKQNLRKIMTNALQKMDDLEFNRVSRRKP